MNATGPSYFHEPQKNEIYFLNERNGSHARLTYFAHDPLRSYFHEPQKNEIYFLNERNGSHARLTYFAHDPLRSYFHEPQKNEIYFLSIKLVHELLTYKLSHVSRKPVFGVWTSLDLNRGAQPQKLGKGLTFRI